MDVRLQEIVLEGPDPWALAAFYRDLLGWEIVYADEDWATVSDGTVRPGFRLSPDHKPPTLPDPELPQQFHLDFFVDDAEAAEEHALASARSRPRPSPPDRAEPSAYTSIRPGTPSAFARPHPGFPDSCDRYEPGV